ncbi:hypothetical protein MWU59_06960 [Flavobacteriaceae bacterium F08102]|nr:hypothetical protein [Flavobacteriaceae bacterium F08102]
MMNFKWYILLLFIGISINGIAQDEIHDDLLKKVALDSIQWDLTAPKLSDPVSVETTVVYSDDKSQIAVITKADILKDWHIYAIVPPSQPYIESDLQIELPDGLRAISTDETPAPYPYVDDIYVYKNRIRFVKYYALTPMAKGKNLKVGLYYQTCDINQCLPPKTKESTFKLK